MAKREHFTSLTGRWRSNRRRGLSLTSLVTAAVALVFLLAATVLTLYVSWQNRQIRVEEADLRTTNTAQKLAQLYADASQEHGQRSLSGTQAFLIEWFSEQSADKDLAWAYIIEPSGDVVIGHLRSHLVSVPQDLETDEQIRSWFLEHQKELADGYVKKSIKLVREQDRAMYADVKIGYSLARIQRDFRRQILITAVLLLVCAVILALGLVVFLRVLILNPIKMLAVAMEDVRRGLFDTRAQVIRGDEIGALAETFNYMMVGLEEREHLEDAFQRYVSKQILDKILTSGDQFDLRGETRRVTVLFSDIRGFTTMSEKLLPEQVVSGLNEYFTEMVDVIFRHDGFINKFVGDAMMAIWGAPFDHDQPELRAVRAAVEMVDALAALNNRRQERGDQRLDIGIGISTGFAVSGNIGHVERMEYTVIGDAVNVAQRIESQTKKVKRTLLISTETYKAVAPHVVAEELPTILVKGKEEPLKLYNITALRAEEATVQESIPAAFAVEAQQATRASAADSITELSFPGYDSDTLQTSKVPREISGLQMTDPEFTKPTYPLPHNHIEQTIPVHPRPQVPQPQVPQPQTTASAETTDLIDEKTLIED